MSEVATDSKPGTIARSALGISQLMSLNHCGPKDIVHGIAGLPRGADLQVADILLEQLQSIEREKHRRTPAQRRRCRAQDERKIARVKRAAGGNDAQGRRLVLLQRRELFCKSLGQNLVEPALDQFVQNGSVGQRSQVRSPLLRSRNRIVAGNTRWRHRTRPAAT